jgi:hypothetical protein
MPSFFDGTTTNFFIILVDSMQSHYPQAYFFGSLSNPSERIQLLAELSDQISSKDCGMIDGRVTIRAILVTEVYFGLFFLGFCCFNLFSGL